MGLFGRIRNLFTLSAARSGVAVNGRPYANGNPSAADDFRAFARVNMGLLLGGLVAVAILAYAVHSLIIVAVDMVLMPVFGLAHPSVNWSQWTVRMSDAAVIPIGMIIHHLLYAALAVVACWFLLSGLRRKPAVTAADRRRTCPACGELVLEVARKCRYCGSDLRDASRFERWRGPAEGRGPSEDRREDRRDDRRRRFRPRWGDRPRRANVGPPPAAPAGSGSQSGS